MDELINQIIEERDASIRLARRNYRAAYVLYVAALLAAITATILSAQNVGSPAVRAVFSAIPGLVVLICNSAQLAARSPIRKCGSPEGAPLPLVKGGVHTPPAKLACGASATPP